jgi:uncharacterized protein (TIGR03067 family)
MTLQNSANAPAFELLKRVSVPGRLKRNRGATDGTRIKHRFYERQRAIGLCLLILACVSTTAVVANDDEPARGVVTKSKKAEAKSTTVKIEIGSDDPNEKKEAADSDNQSTSADALPESESKKSSNGKKAKTLTDDKSDESSDGNSGVGRGTVRNSKSAKSKESGKAGTPSGMMPPDMNEGAPPAMGRSSGKSKKGAPGAGQPMGGMGSPMPGSMGPGAMGPGAMGPGAMGSGSMGPGGMGSGMGMAANPPRGLKLYAEGGHVILKQSDGGDVLWGYSEKLGKWTRLAIPKGKDLLAPIVGDTVGVFWGEDHVYAYSSTTGRWGELATSASPIVSFHKVAIRDHDKISVFSDVSGRWASTSDEGDEPPEQPSATDNHNPPADVRPNPLVDTAGRGVVIGDFDNDGRLDLFVTGTSEKLKAADLLKSLQEQCREAERQTIQAAASYRQTRQRLGDKDPNTRELEVKLARLVQESFDRRQQAHRLEAEILRRRLQRVDDRLSDRERLKSQIIQHRLEELQNTNVRWDAEADDQARLGKFRIHQARNDQARIGEHVSPAPRSPAHSAPDEAISEFVPRGSASVTVGVVANINDDEWIEISPKDISGIRVGDELEVIRPEVQFTGGFQPIQRFARVFVVKAEPEIAVARMVESMRVLRDNKYGWDPILKGFSVSRPVATDEEEQAVAALEHFQGKWRCVGLNDNGRETPPDELRESQRTLFITGNRFRLADLSDGKVFKDRRLAIDSELGQVDFLVDERLPQDDDRRRGICHMEGEKLRICCGKEYPTEFKPGPDVLLMTFVRDPAPRHEQAIGGHESLGAPGFEQKKQLDTSHPGDTRDDNELQMVFVFCPHGDFMMSTSQDEPSGGGTRSVTLTKDFWLGKYEVTQSEFEHIMGKNPSNFSATGGGSLEVAEIDTSRLPVERVSWIDAMEFCFRLTERERIAGRLSNKWEYTLPTEAQWEYASRTATAGVFGFGDKLNGQEANCDGEKPWGTDQPGPFLCRTTSVGSYPPNAWGLCDMNGNVWEWCRDWFISRIPLNDRNAASRLDPEATSERESWPRGRANRGGAWSSAACRCRTVARDWNAPESAYSDLGFRVALSSVQDRGEDD